VDNLAIVVTGADWHRRIGSIVDLVPDCCRHCDCGFAGKRQEVSTQGEPRRHQVTELPPIEAHITEYRC
jgi:hypothetical protein